MLQQSPLPQSWREFIFLSLGSLVSLIPETIRRYRDRKKSALENAEKEAEVEQSHAEIASLRLRDGLATGEGVGRMITTMIETGDQLRDLQRRTIQAEADAQAAQMFVEQLTAAMKLAICEHYPQGVRLSDYLPSQLKSSKNK